MRTPSQGIAHRQVYAEGFTHENGTPTVITTGNVQHGLTIFEVGHINGPDFVFTEGSSGTITEYADYSGTVAGTVKATDADHGLVTGDIITIEGGATYTGIYQITRIDDNNFYFTAVWDIDDGAQPWSQPDYILSNIETTGDFKVTLSVSCASANQLLEFHIAKNTAFLEHFKIENQWSTANDIFAVSMTGIDPIAKGDKFFIIVANQTSTSNLTVRNGNFTIVSVNA